MPNLMTADLQIQCPHGGRVTVTTSNQKAKAGAAILRPTDTFVVAGCAFNIAGAPHPCMSVKWQAPAQKVQAAGAPALTESSVGMCMAADNAPQGTAMVSGVQFKAAGL